jgi:hypothetical protein
MAMAGSTNTQKKIRIGEGLIRFCVAVLLISSMVKFLHPAKAVAYMSFLGYANEKLFLIAGMEVIIAALFLLRSTRVFGLLLLSAYFGGAISAHLAYHPLTGAAPIIVFGFNHPYLATLIPAVVLACAWLGVWLRHQEMFGHTQNPQQDAELRVVRAA